jgi:hypothetical protein
LHLCGLQFQAAEVQTPRAWPSACCHRPELGHVAALDADDRQEQGPGEDRGDEDSEAENEVQQHHYSAFPLWSRGAVRDGDGPVLHRAELGEEREAAFSRPR